MFWKLSLSAKISHQKMRWIYGILLSALFTLLSFVESKWPIQSVMFLVPLRNFPKKRKIDFSIFRLTFWQSLKHFVVLNMYGENMEMIFQQTKLGFYFPKLLVRTFSVKKRICLFCKVHENRLQALDLQLY